MIAEPVSEPTTEPVAEPEPEPEPAKIVVDLPPDTSSLTLDAAALETWLDLAEHLYSKTERNELGDALVEAAKVFVKVAWFALRRWPVSGWTELPSRERRQDPIPALVRYVARNTFAGLAARFPRVDVAQLMAAQSLLVLMAGKSDGNGLDLEKLSRAADAAAGLPAATTLPGGATSAQRAGSGSSESDASGSAGESAGEQPEPQRRRRALGLRWRGQR